jgi:hypothetical protein
VDWKKQIFEQKSLSDVYWSARCAKTSITNRIILWGIGGVILLFLALNMYYAGKYISSKVAADLIQEWSEVGISLTTSVLGFLITGFAIFSTVTKPDLFIALAQIPHKSGGISRLQYIFFNFLCVFIDYILLLTISLFIKIGLTNGAPLYLLGKWILTISPKIGLGILSILMLVLLLWFVIAILRLKSFIWNLYQSVLLTIATEAELKDSKK